MRVVELKPLREHPEDFDRLEREIIRVLRQKIYIPLVKELRESPKQVLKNSFEELCEAIRTGRIKFHRGQFTGRFTASLSRELKSRGARWDRTQGSWKIPLSSLGPDLRVAIATAEDRMLRTARAIDRRLSEIIPEEVAEAARMERIFDRTIWKTEKEFQKNVKNITVVPTLTDRERERLANTYTENLRYYIKEWTQEEISKLRQQVLHETLQGNRRDTIQKILEESYGVGQRKAKFLARQETGLLMAKYRQGRFQDAGSKQYRWSSVTGTAEHPVRPMHKELNGKLISWSSPPIINKKGDRKHAGEDYNCRCVARPIIKFA